jgi:hypothetical protein
VADLEMLDDFADEGVTPTSFPAMEWLRGSRRPCCVAALTT